jgi:hypothetical protein
MLGEQVTTFAANSGKEQVIWNTSTLPAGSYAVVLKDGENRIVRTVVKLAR